MAGTQQTKPVKFVAADFRIKRIAKPISNRSEPILTHTTKGRLTTIERVRIQQHQGRDRDDASENINPVFSQHDREVSTKFHKTSIPRSSIIEE
jgi:hypothetical protein